MQPSCGEFTTFVWRPPHPSPPPLTTGECCCSCGGRDFEDHKRLLAEDCLFICPVCNHSMHDRPIKEPLVHRGCGRCGHSCNLCTDDPPSNLHAMATCGACAATTLYCLESGEGGRMWGRTSFFVCPGPRRWDTNCRSCGYSPRRWKHEDAISPPRWIPFRLVTEPIPIMVVEEDVNK